MLRIGSMNMLLHGVENPDIRYRDSLAQDHAGEEEKYTLVLANPPFAGSLDYENTAKDLLQIVKTKKTELLFLALFLRVLKPGGRAAVIVPDGVLFGSSKAHKELRRILVEDQKLDAVVSLPGGTFKPYAGVSTAILVFTKTNSGGTDTVWFYDVEADGWSLDDKRTPLLAEVRSGGGGPQDSKAFSTSGFPFVRAGSLPKLLDGATEYSLELIEPEVARQYGLSLFPAGTVLFAKSGMSATKGHVYRLRNPAYVVNHLAALIPHDPEDSAFLVRVLQRFSPTVLIKDPAYPSIRLGDIESMKG